MALGVRRNLSNLAMSEPCNQITSLLDACVQEVVKQVPQHLEEIQTFPRHLKDKVLHLMCKRGSVTDDSIDKVVHSKTTCLNLTECELSDRGLAKVAVCQNLRILDLNSTKDSRTTISSQGLEIIFTNCPYLQTVYLRRCLSVDDGAIVVLSAHCPNLRELNIGGCELISDISLEALGRNCSRLESIQFSKTQVTDFGVHKLATGESSQSLTEIMMDGCTNLTDASVEMVMTHCPNISILVFHDCPNITEHSRQVLGVPGSKVKQIMWTVY